MYDVEEEADDEQEQYKGPRITHQETPCCPRTTILTTSPRMRGLELVPTDKAHVFNTNTNCPVATRRIHGLNRLHSTAYLLLL